MIKLGKFDILRPEGLQNCCKVGQWQHSFSFYYLDTWDFLNSLAFLIVLPAGCILRHNEINDGKISLQGLLWRPWHFVFSISYEFWSSQGQTERRNVVHMSLPPTPHSVHMAMWHIVSIKMVLCYFTVILQVTMIFECRFSCDLSLWYSRIGYPLSNEQAWESKLK